MDILTSPGYLVGLSLGFTFVCCLETWNTRRRLKILNKFTVDIAKRMHDLLLLVEKKTDVVGAQQLDFMKLVHGRWDAEDKKTTGDGDAC